MATRFLPLRLNRKFGLSLVGLLAFALGALTVGISRSEGQPELEGLSVYASNLREVSGASQYVVIATPLDERKETIVEDGREKREDLVWQFELVESLRSERTLPDRFEVRLTVALYGPSGRMGLRAISPDWNAGQEYVLFLAEAADGTRGPTLGPAVEAFVAELDDGNLKFESAGADVSGLQGATLDELRVAVTEAPLGSFPPVPNQPLFDSRLAEIGLKIDGVVANAERLDTEPKLRAALLEAGLTAEALGDWDACFKLESLLTDRSGVELDMGCDALKR